jgi:hypothetical protein
MALGCSQCAIEQELNGQAESMLDNETQQFPNDS